MALVVKDRVKETSTTTGTGTLTLAGAVAGFQAFSVLGDGNTTYYTIVSGTDWEVGIGTYTASGTTLSRDTILGSSNSGSAVNLGAGDKDVFCTYSAEKSVYEQADNKINASSGVVSGALFENPTTIATNYTVATGNNALTAGPITVNSGVSVTVPSGSRWVVL